MPSTQGFPKDSSNAFTLGWESLCHVVCEVLLGQTQPRRDRVWFTLRFTDEKSGRVQPKVEGRKPEKEPVAKPQPAINFQTLGCLDLGFVRAWTFWRGAKNVAVYLLLCTPKFE